MTTKVKTKIQRLLRQLDGDDDGLPGGSAEELRTTASEEEEEDLASLSPTRRAAAAIDATHGSLSVSSVDAASDQTATMTRTTSSDAPVDDFESRGPYLFSMDSTPLPQRPSRSPGPKRSSHMAAGHAERVAVLERKVIALMADNRNLQAAFSDALARKNAEVSELQVSPRSTSSLLSLPAKSHAAKSHPLQTNNKDTNALSLQITHHPFCHRKSFYVSSPQQFQLLGLF